MSDDMRTKVRDDKNIPPEPKGQKDDWRLALTVVSAKLGVQRVESPQATAFACLEKISEMLTTVDKLNRLLGEARDGHP